MVQRGPSRESRGDTLDGVLALGPMASVMLIGAAAGASMLMLWYALWFFGSCVFVDHPVIILPDDRLSGVPAVPQCQAIPSLAWTDILLILAALAGAGLVYAVVYRYSVRHRYERRILGVRYNAADLVCILLSPLLAWVWGWFLPNAAEATGWIRLVVITSPGFFFTWIRLFVMLGVALLTRRLDPDLCDAAMVHTFLARQFAMERLDTLSVRCDGTSLTIKGPFDAVDVRRIEDLVANRYHMRYTVTVESTLPPEAYWRPYNEDLAPSGYVSPPLRATSIPVLLIYGFVGVSLAILFAVWIRSPGVGFSSNELRYFFATAGGRVPGIERPPAESLAGGAGTTDAPFTIDVVGSVSACPTLTRNATLRWRLTTEGRQHRADRGNVVRIHYTDRHYFLFVINRESRRCTHELAYDTLERAQAAARAYTYVTSWTSIPNGEDWRSVPPDS